MESSRYEKINQQTTGENMHYNGMTYDQKEILLQYRNEFTEIHNYCDRLSGGTILNLLMFLKTHTANTESVILFKDTKSLNNNQHKILLALNENYNDDNYKWCLENKTVKIELYNKAVLRLMVEPQNEEEFDLKFKGRCLKSIFIDRYNYDNKQMYELLKTCLRGNDNNFISYNKPRNMGVMEIYANYKMINWMFIENNHHLPEDLKKIYKDIS